MELYHSRHSKTLDPQHTYSSSAQNGRLFLLSAVEEIQNLALIGAEFLEILGVFVPVFYLPMYAVANGMSTKVASYLTFILNGAPFLGRVTPGVVVRASRSLLLWLLATF